MADDGMTDGRLQEIVATTVKRRRFMETNFRGHFITQGHFISHLEELAAEVTRLKGETKTPLCLTCKGTGIHYEHHDYCTETLACPDCEGTGKQ